MFRKAFSFTLALCVVALLMQPCQDVFALTAGTAGSTAVVRPEQPDDSNCDSETCSPFCICSCCSTFVTSCTFAAAITAETESNHAGTGSFAGYANPCSQGFQASIWQPPKA